ncbi:hypothetical protein AB0N61_13710 [Microbacterium sp. NPDC089320]|uniref:hypothetical protein n=1 Tax=Microbacterium sp. NPDC089320 TaxID=3155182 RepID=UPI0034422990
MSDQQQNSDQPGDAGQPHAQPGQPHAQPGQPYAQPGEPYAQPGQPHAQPGQPHAQPGQPYAQPGQPHAQPGQPYGVTTPPYSPGPTAPRAGGLGRTAFVVAVSGAAVGLFFQIITPFLYMSIGYQFVDLLGNLVNLIVLAVAGTGLALGLIALRRPAPHLLAAIAIGVGGSTVVGTLISWVSSLFYYFGF